MSHQPYDTWLYDQAELSHEQALSLQNHLLECPECRELQRSWNELNTLIQNSIMISPQPGFSLRWSASLAERKMQQQLRNAKQLFFGLLAASFLSLLMLAITMIATTSPINLVLSVFHVITRILIEGSQIQRVLIPILRSLPPVVPIGLWVILSSTFSILSLVWVFSMWQITTHGVKKHEKFI
jgi:hypothetical protein